MSRKNTFSRRDFVGGGAMLAAACAAPSDVFSRARKPPSTDEAVPIRLGLASYTFRNISRTQMIGFMKQFDVLALNAKDVKHHLPTNALADYTAAGIRLHAAGAIYFTKD
jgi:hypothetical protein